MSEDGDTAEVEEVNLRASVEGKGVLDLERLRRERRVINERPEPDLGQHFPLQPPAVHPGAVVPENVDPVSFLPQAAGQRPEVAYVGSNSTI